MLSARNRPPWDKNRPPTLTVDSLLLSSCVRGNEGWARKIIENIFIPTIKKMQNNFHRDTALILLLRRYTIIWRIFECEQAASSGELICRLKLKSSQLTGSPLELGNSFRTSCDRVDDKWWLSLASTNNHNWSWAMVFRISLTSTNK